MMREHLRSHEMGVFFSSELAVLQRVFDDTCNSVGIKKKSSQAEGLAAVLLGLYEKGIDDEDKLHEMVSRIDFL